MVATKRRILFVSANRGGGGSEELWVQTTSRILQLGGEVLSATTWSSRATNRLKQLEQAKVRHLSLNESFAQRLTARLLPKVASKNSPLRRIIRDWKPQLIVFNSGTLLDGVSHLQEIASTGLPYVTITHLVSTDNWPDDATSEALVKLFSGAQIAGFVSNHNLSLFEKQTASRLNNSRIWRNPYLVSYKRQLTWPDERVWKLAFPARIHPRTKGHDLLLEVLSQEKWRTRPLQVSIFGKGPWENCLVRSIKMRDLEAKVRFCGHVHDIQALWDAHHALLLPSRHEGLPICVVEALMAGRPCIVNPAGGSAELLEEGVTGFISSECSAAALDQAMERAWEKRHEWQSMGIAAADHVRRIIPPDPAAVLAKELLTLSAKN